ncbi:copper resistance CopC family protein [Streptosporangium soli]|nr:copper resistance protein CopC [Streptosporangium sp. KLBMP 9127]
MLKSSSPAKDARVTAVEQVVLEFNGAVTFPKVVVLNAGEKQFQQGEAEISGKKVIQKVAGVLPPGKYTIGYRVVSSDGHPRTGQVPFTVIAAPSPSPSEATSPSETPPASPSASPTSSAQPVRPDLTPQAVGQDAAARGSGGGTVVVLGIGVVAVAAGAGFFLARRLRRSGR